MSKEKPTVEYSERFGEVVLTLEDAGMLYCDVMTEREFEDFVTQCTSLLSEIKSHQTVRREAHRLMDAYDKEGGT